MDTHIQFWLIFLGFALAYAVWTAHQERRADANWESKLHLPRHGYGKS